MKLLCLSPHRYQDTEFEPGLVYELDDTLATRLLKDFGPVNSDITRRNSSARFEIAAPDAEVTGNPPPEVEEPEMPSNLPGGAPQETLELEQYPADEPGEPPPDLSGMTRAQLEAFAAEQGLTVTSSMTVAELRADLQAQLDARQTEPAT